MKVQAFCNKCGEGLVMHATRDLPAIDPCRGCIRAATKEGYIAGKAYAIQQLYESDENGTQKTNDANRTHGTS